jgi:quercetin dioxygenase-like cupin family protein
MSLPHAVSGEVINIRPLDEKLKESVSIALFRTNHLELMRLVLVAGKSMPEHRVAGEVTIQCLEGAIELHAHQKMQTLHAGDLVYLAGGESHALRAIEDSSVLLTILFVHPSAEPFREGSSEKRT